jgi:ribosome biogenesis GTPase / thiamine phosphate phosphatase
VSETPRLLPEHILTGGGRGSLHGECSGLVTETVGGVYRIRFDDGSEADAVLRGRLKREARTGSRVVAGDRVTTAGIPGEETFTIEEVHPRRSELVRAGPGGRGARIVAANLDECLVVLSADEPPYDPEVGDRFLVLAESCDIHPRLVINKADVPGAGPAIADARERYVPLGYDVLVTSAETREGLDSLARAIEGRVSALVGPSGVGKSSLLNALDSNLTLRTAAVSERGGRGRHTTVGARLLPFRMGGWVADTPGFSDVRLWGIEPERIATSFPEFRERAESCRFRGCSHLHEPDCAVKAAVQAGTILHGRFDSYRKMMEA